MSFDVFILSGWYSSREASGPRSYVRRRTNIVSVISLSSLNGSSMSYQKSYTLTNSNAGTDFSSRRNCAAVYIRNGNASSNRILR